jgi:diguanylate cyclase (GGDEF)-like protein
MAHDSALVVHADAEHPAEETALLRLGAEAVLAGDGTAATSRALRQAVWRKRVEHAARTAYATDLATGLPHQTQLLEHMTQLLALREREPAPMVLLVLRVDGFAQAAQRLGTEAGNVLRRKVAVRLRGGLRASDVVAALTPEAFGVLLGRLESKHDGERVAAKLVKSLELPLTVAGQPCRVSAQVGLALFPDHGKDAQALLQRASAQAASVATVGPQGLGATVHRIGGPAANDQP